MVWYKVFFQLLSFLEMTRHIGLWVSCGPTHVIILNNSFLTDLASHHVPFVHVNVSFVTVRGEEKGGKVASMDGMCGVLSMTPRDVVLTLEGISRMVFKIVALSCCPW